MYSYPYGDDQQLNLNWIINEIINLHKQLDPNYETPSFTQVYPYSNLNRLNLDWVLSELKALKELAPEPVPTEVDIQAVAEALVALPFDSSKAYQIYDYISRDGEIWRATEAIPAGGVWDSSKWFKTKLGTDLAVLDRWINAINANLTALQNTVKDLSSDEISDDSDAGGATVKESLNNLKGSLNANESALAIVANGNTHAAIANGQYVFVKNHSTLASGLYRATGAIPMNGTISSTNVTPVPSGGLNAIGVNATFVRGVANPDLCSKSNIYGYKIGKLFFISGWFMLSSVPTQGDTIITGLPKFAFEQNVLVYDQDAKTFRTLIAGNNATSLIRGSGSDFTGLTGHYLNLMGVYLIYDE